MNHLYERCVGLSFDQGLESLQVYTQSQFVLLTETQDCIYSFMLLFLNDERQRLV